MVSDELASVLLWKKETSVNRAATRLLFTMLTLLSLKPRSEHLSYLNACQEMICYEEESDGWFLFPVVDNVDLMVAIAFVILKGDFMNDKAAFVVRSELYPDIYAFCAVLLLLWMVPAIAWTSQVCQNSICSDEKGNLNKPKREQDSIPS
jgi:hypothetical protein